MPPPTAFPVFDTWYKTCDWLLQTCDKMPKHIRFTLSGRIANLALDITALLIEAVYTTDRKPLLTRTNLLLEQLRILLRLAKDRHYISLQQHAFAANSINETGKMVGGWLKSIAQP
ncbi:MAG: diversity-generating retroelement protein Avd [Saprospiraceae bacterium]|nr:diversity-generating retroelement protein Avd [Saprospiraceae bacterium]